MSGGGWGIAVDNNHTRGISVFPLPYQQYETHIHNLYAPSRYHRYADSQMSRSETDIKTPVLSDDTA